MLTIGLITLDDALKDELIPSSGHDWNLHPIKIQDSRKKAPGRALPDRRYTAIAIVGQNPKKAKLARDALLHGKHVLIDFPPGQNSKEASQLVQIAKSNDLCLYSPNLMKTEPGLQELRRSANRPDAKLLSLTITCGSSAHLKASQLSMKLTQLLDLIEWSAGSRVTSILAEKYLRSGKASALGVLASLANGVRALCNLYLAPTKTHHRFWLDAIFDDSILHIAPDAQTLKLDCLNESESKNLSWSRSTLAFALDDFSEEIRDQGKRSLDVEQFRRIHEMVDCAFGKQRSTYSAR